MKTTPTPGTQPEPTAGPWEYSEPGSSHAQRWINRLAGSGIMIQFCDDESDEQIAADVALIASAPRLRAERDALRVAVAEIKAWAAVDRPGRGRVFSVLNIISRHAKRAALARCGGE